MAGDTPQGPISVSIVRDDGTDTYKSVIRTAHGNQRLTTPKSNVKPSWWRKLVGAGPSGQGILTSLFLMHIIIIDITRRPSRCCTQSPSTQTNCGPHTPQCHPFT